MFLFFMLNHSQTPNEKKRTRNSATCKIKLLLSTLSLPSFTRKAAVSHLFNNFRKYYVTKVAKIYKGPLNVMSNL